MRLDDIIGSMQTIAVHGDAATDIASLTFDSRSAGPGSCFFAIEGERSDGHDFMAQATAAGAAAVVCRRMPERPDPNVTYVEVADTHEALGIMASAFYGHPSRELQLVGITGTNGKTTTATLLYDLFRALGHESGLISTVVYCVGSSRHESTHTTPDPIRLNAMLREMADSGCRYCFMEVSSHAIVQRRIGGLRFAGGVFTNITREHLDYHKTFAEYIRAKQRFFDDLPADAFALTDIDDRNGRIMVQNTRAGVRTMSTRTAADYRCRVVEMHVDGMLLQFGQDEVWVNLIGDFNARNLLAVYAAALSLGAPRAEVLRLLSTLRSVSGRCEYLRSDDGVTAVVDYAHTPDALKNILETMNRIRPSGSRLTVVCGCGGDRDRTKRPEMARTAVQYADMAVFTSDNPRTESPEAILDQMTAGVTAGDRWLRITDRAEAIRTAVVMSSPGDMVVVAGKGHETYQIVGTERRPFDDREHIRSAFAARPAAKRK